MSAIPEIGLDLRLTINTKRGGSAGQGLLARNRKVNTSQFGRPMFQVGDSRDRPCKIGAVLVLTPTAVSEIEYVLRQGDISTLFMIEEFRGNSYVESLYSIAPELKSLADPLQDRLESASLPELKRVIIIENKTQPGMMLYSQVSPLGEGISDETLVERQSSLDPHDVIQMQYTSGTTGSLKV
jgi:acyl-coenzyme A synthetase/AMP-(fatty) acid ligase